VSGVELSEKKNKFDDEGEKNKNKLMDVYTSLPK